MFRPAAGGWSIKGIGEVQLGLPGDVTVPADYTGDGRADSAVFRDGWYGIRGAGGYDVGASGDIAMPLS